MAGRFRVGDRLLRAERADPRDTDHHAEILEAARAGDAEAARLAMKGHLQWARDRL
jgi:DNA-binding GntR family transcriptional regulator